MTVQLYFDGACDVNPGGHGGAGFVIKEDGKIYEEKYEYLGKFPEMTNNIAEWCALIKGLEFCLEQGYFEIEVYGDSKLVVNQSAGIFKVKASHLKPYKQKFKELLKYFKSFYIEWIPREKNEAADKMSQKALEGYANVRQGFKLK